MLVNNNFHNISRRHTSTFYLSKIVYFFIVVSVNFIWRGHKF